ncbi:MAG TPA: cytochrome c oxidase subunit II, partial [Acidimicrobiales bacterium]
MRAVLAIQTPSPLSPAGSEASQLAGIWWLLLGLAVAVGVGVLALVLVGLARHPSADHPDNPDDLASDDRDRRFIVLGGLVMPVLVLSVAAVATIRTTQTLRRPSRGQLEVNVTAAQWFWRVQYPDGGITSANEVVLPVDRPVQFTLRSEDVIHSFWVPQLAGKMDVIPGQTNRLAFTPRKVGTYLGECAEFCGLQHAHMRFLVRVVSASRFAAWRRGESPASP